jgi:hypothetical protein
MTFTHQILDTRFPVPDHQLIPVAITVTITITIAVTVIAMTYEQYPDIVPVDPNRM